LKPLPWGPVGASPFGTRRVYPQQRRNPNTLEPDGCISQYLFLGRCSRWSLSPTSPLRPADEVSRRGRSCVPAAPRSAEASPDAESARGLGRFAALRRSADSGGLPLNGVARFVLRTQYVRQPRPAARGLSFAIRLGSSRVVILRPVRRTSFSNNFV
jgi:hypothetical protein